MVLSGWFNYYAELYELLIYSTTSKIINTISWSNSNINAFKDFIESYIDII